MRKMMNLSWLTIILVIFKRTPPYMSLSLKNPLELIRSFQNHLKMKVFKEKKLRGGPKKHNHEDKYM